MISGAGTDFEIRRWDVLLQVLCLYRSVVGTLGETIGGCFVEKLVASALVHEGFDEVDDFFSLAVLFAFWLVLFV
jgi:hypothetical protein